MEGSCDGLFIYFFNLPGLRDAHIAGETVYKDVFGIN